MADIASYLHAIEIAVYGEEVRGSIHDALAAMNVEAIDALSTAKTSRDSAAANAAAAATSASNAATSEANAKISEDNAKSLETSCKASEAAAKAAAAAASTSETNAANSEAVASAAAAAALASKNAAAISESNAATSETNAIAAKTAAQAAQVAAEAAQGAAEGARTGAEAARDAAQSAKVGAEAARDAAAASATNAATSEASSLNAKTAAETAQAKAEAAQAAAEAAQAAAESAKDDAEDSASDAATSATNAAASEASAKEYSGKPAIPNDTTRTWWIWNATTQQYEDTGFSSEIEGPTGNGISKIELTSGTHAPGTTDTYTITMTDGSTCNFTVFNGHNGTGAGDVLGVQFELFLPKDDWADGKLTVGDSRLIALRAYKYFIVSDEICEEEYIECKVKPKNITSTGFITFESETDPTEDITVTVIRLELSA